MKKDWQWFKDRVGKMVYAFEDDGSGINKPEYLDGFILDITDAMVAHADQPFIMLFDSEQERSDYIKNLNNEK